MMQLGTASTACVLFAQLRLFLPAHLTGFPTARSTGPSQLKPLVFIFFSHGMFFPQHIKITGSFSIFSLS